MWKSASAPRVKQPPEIPLEIPLCSHPAPSSAHSFGARAEGSPHSLRDGESSSPGPGPQTAPFPAQGIPQWKTWRIHFATAKKGTVFELAIPIPARGKFGAVSMDRDAHGAGQGLGCAQGTWQGQRTRPVCISLVVAAPGRTPLVPQGPQQ